MRSCDNGRGAGEKYCGEPRDADRVSAVHYPRGSVSFGACALEPEPCYDDLYPEPMITSYEPVISSYEPEPMKADDGPCAVYRAPEEMDLERGTGSSSPTAGLDMDAPTDHSTSSMDVPSIAPRDGADQHVQALEKGRLSPVDLPPVVSARLPHDAQEAQRALVRKLDKLRAQYPVRGTRQINCLLIGRAGNGKSSLINSIYRTTTGCMDDLCKEGTTDASCTIKYTCSPAIWEKDALPLVLFDTKGLPDAKDKATVTLLENLLRGRFKPNHSMNNPKFRDLHMLPQKALTVDAVVFVYAYGAVFPHRLATALYNVAQARGVTVVPVITFYDQVEHDDQLEVHLDCCRRTFNTHPLYVTNLSAFRHERNDAAMATSKQTVLDIVSQILVYGQQHQRFKKVDTAQPLRAQDGGKDCTIM